MALNLKIKRNIVSLGFNCFIFTSATISALSILLLILFIVNNGIAPFLHNRIKISNFLFSTNWDPTSNIQKSYGILSFIINSALTTLFSVLIALPIGLGFAIYLFEKAKGFIKKYYKLS